MKKLFIATILAGIVSTVAFIFERLALTDIFHGESDLDLEWSIVNVAFLPILVFHVLGIVSVIIAVRRTSPLGLSRSMGRSVFLRPGRHGKRERR